MPNSLVRADRKRQHARDANHRDRQRYRGEYAKHDRVQPIRREHFGADISERGRVLDGLIGRHVTNHARDRSDQRVRISASVDEQASANDQALLKRVIDGDGRLRNDVRVVNVGSDADDAVRRHQSRLSASVPGKNCNTGSVQ